ncbi:hypothetical protein PG990_005733 [Apiospora arundinis]|uniref:Cobalt/magnesium transport protein CorA n=1 Tax=Apiospora arundinis TaxID=335852 RepID=A0ABR2J8R2_9PEZI
MTAASEKAMSHSSSEATANETFPDLPAPSPPGTTQTSTSAPVPTTRPPPTITTTSTRSARPQVHYDLNIDTNLPPSASHLSPPPISPVMATGLSRSESQLSPNGVRRRFTRSNTFRTVKEFEEGWHPGAEPGLDTSKPDGGHASMENLHAECQITIVDFSPDDIAIHELDNQQMIDFIELPQPSWVKCRWINVNGISWDVIQSLGNHKGLHRLAIEDLMNPHNRTKADWYASHAFLIMTCQKLVRVVDDDDSDDEGEDGHELHRVKSQSSWKDMKRGLKQWWNTIRQDDYDSANNNISLEKGGPRPLGDTSRNVRQTTGLSDVFNPNTLCTLQRYHASSNDARTDYMERHSALVARGLAVMAEQVSLFITSDNTVIAFFEQSADDVEKPILARLSSPDTILRQSCDASMVGQAIIDAIIDMAIPVAACYADVVGDLELDVLTKPSIKHTRDLYIITSEINKMASFVNPIASLISALRDHKTLLPEEVVTQELQNPGRGVIITPMTYTYLGDVYDHCVLITEQLNQIRKSADDMIDLIFNTISANQNESMKQLTVVSVIFLPLTFLSGYFGQNFEDFPELHNSPKFFWWIASPVCVFIILLLMREMIWQWLVRFTQRRQIISVRKRKRKGRAHSNADRRR